MPWGKIIYSGKRVQVIIIGVHGWIPKDVKWQKLLCTWCITDLQFSLLTILKIWLVLKIWWVCLNAPICRAAQTFLLCTHQNSPFYHCTSRKRLKWRPSRRRVWWRENKMTGVEREEMCFDLLCMALFVAFCIEIERGREKSANHMNSRLKISGKGWVFYLLHLH